ncbi:MAG: hypothetical protein I3J02_10655 [Prevotella sp.]|nr:hypothetical protein [Prevotella sp.]
MKKYSLVVCTSIVASIFMTSFLLTGCNDKASKKIGHETDSTVVEDVVPDTTIYGTCGEGTAMHSLELITDAGDTLQYMIGENENGEQDIQGGLLVGDRLAVIEGESLDGEKTAQKIINLTTLLGKWVSLDKNFEILEGGVVKSNVKAESNPWTNWKILNGQLVLNKDTFTIDKLGTDSLYLENRQGIFTYKRP